MANEIHDTAFKLVFHKIELKITSTNALNPVCLGPGKEAFGNAKERPGGFLGIIHPLCYHLRQEEKIIHMIYGN